MARELSIVVPALNEEAFIEKTVQEIVVLGRACLERFEIILVNDGSRDGTPRIMDALAQSADEISVVHHARPHGVGSAFWEGVEMAQYPYLTLIPGDNAFNDEGLKQMFLSVGSADLVVTYRQNATHARTFFRILLSKAFRLCVILLSGFRLRDFYSAEVYPVEMVRTMKSRPAGYTYQIETLVYLLNHGVSYVQVPTLLNLRETRNSQVLRWKTVREVLKLYLRLLLRKSHTGTA